MSELFPEFVSGSEEVADAVLLKVVGVAGAVTTIWTFSPENLGIEPRLQVTVPDAWLHVPCDGVAETKVTPDGSRSVSETPVAVDGPALLTETLYLSSSPTPTGSGKSDLMTERSADAGTTVVCTVEVLLAGIGSDSAEATDAVLVKVVGAPGVLTAISTFAFADLAILPRLQVTVPEACVHVPCVGIAERKVTPAGSVSVSVTPVAVDGPKLWTSMSYVSWSFTATGFGEPDLETRRFAEGGTTVVTTVELLSLGSGSVSAEVTDAVLVSIAGAPGAVTTMSTPRDVVLGIEPMLHVTVPDTCVQVPCVGVAETKVTPAGSVSVSVTPVAVDGPALNTLTSYVNWSFTATGSGKADLKTERSAEGGTTMVSSVAVLLSRSGSVIAEVTEAVLVRVPGVPGAVTTISTNWVVDLAIESNVQVTVPDRRPQASCGVTETKLTPAGSVSVSVTSVVADGPALWTVTSYVIWSFTATVLGKPDLKTERSAEGGTKVVSSIQLLLPGSESGLVEVTVTVLSTVVGVSGAVTTMSTDSEPNSSNVVHVQMTGSTSLQIPPPLAVAESSVTPSGRSSVIVTPAAGRSPKFSTDTWYVYVSSKATGSWLSNLKTARSALGPAASLARIVAVPVASVMVPATGSESTTSNVSSPSSSRSPLTRTVNASEMSPGANVTVPDASS